ncbi:glycosyltransferase family 4 protein [Mucilaginibacter ginsenosidivorax]|uniref:Glycosyltransferase family 4 protein n=2 Tax=Mucilaginibacter ginsenosidivorax TaxID=862126 RepID=A0A5B8WAU7_9SPHI|nr:glycosyltransferase family 4 protein [Mucilaginibacter ginsenosidivorax]
MSLPYFAANGWHAEVIMVDEQYADLPMDELLLQSIPVQVKVHKVKALKKSITSKLGLGSIALRSLWFYRQKINELLKTHAYDLIYFSTTQFPVCILGAYFKKRNGIPYVIDMQDPWFSNYYENKPKAQRPPKYWFSYRLNKYLEPIAMNSVDGLVSVSDNYISDLKNRYPAIKNIPAVTITFGAFEPDMQIAEQNKNTFPNLLDSKYTNIVYIGRGGADMHRAVTPLFNSLRAALNEGNEALKSLRFYFIGTSYAANGQGKPSILPLARQMGVEESVIEITDRISYYHTLITLQQADALFIPGSDDPKYTASKIYPYLLTPKPLLAIFNKASSVINIMKEYGVKQVYDYETVTNANISTFLSSLINGSTEPPQYHSEAVNKYSARQMTINQCKLFDSITGGEN